MQTTAQHNSLAKSIAIIISAYVLTFSASSQAEQAGGELAMTDVIYKWQVTRLFEPSKSQRKLEQQGYISVYDNLPDKTVDKALDNNFDRIENMMFTRVVITKENGEPQRDESGNVVTEDDGC